MPVQTHLRQLDLFKPANHNAEINIIGAGATGSILAFFLTKMGCNNIKIYDFDFVEEHNFSNQLFKRQDLNLYKAEQTSKICEDFSGVKIKFENCKYEKQALKGIVVIGVDTMKCRKEIFEYCKTMKDVHWVIDPRASAEQYRVYTIDMRLKCEQAFWEKHYYPDEHSEQTTCTASAIIYGVGFLVSTICNQIKRVLENQSYYREVIADITNYMFLTK
jgi:hypothetical protein